MWTNNPDLAKVWDSGTNLGYILVGILQTYVNEHPIDENLKGNHKTHINNLLSILKNCRVEIIRETTRYQVIQTL